jgi:thiamine phosphate synthase YjbQ (UPF0047 family)
MDTLASASACRHTKFAIQTTRPTEFIDLTDRLDLLVAEAGLRSGFVNVLISSRCSSARLQTTARIGTTTRPSGR